MGLSVFIKNQECKFDSRAEQESRSLLISTGVRRYIVWGNLGLLSSQRYDHRFLAENMRDSAACRLEFAKMSRMNLKSFFIPHSNARKNTANSNYVEFGEGPALVILPSPLSMAVTYRKFALHLGRHFRVFILELPGCGFHISSRHVMDMNELIHDVIDFLYACDMDRALHLKEPLS